MDRGIKRVFKSAAQRILFTFEQFGRHELANHAAAGAYAFLLSAVPALLVVVYVSALLARLLNLDVTFAGHMLAPYLETFGGGKALEAFFGKALSVSAAAFGVVNLVWAGRLFVVSIQRGIRVIFQGSASVNPVRENLLTFAVELVVLLAAVALIAASQIIKAMSASLNWAPIKHLLGAAVPLALSVLPTLALWLFIFLTYRNIPPKRPRSKTAALCSALALCVYGLFGLGVGAILNVERYGILYGILGNLVVLLIKVYTFFWMYFYGAELMFTTEHFDALLFSRFHRNLLSVRQPNTVERFLFSEPPRLMRKYARQYSAGSLIFEAGDCSREVFFLYKGSVAVYLEKPFSLPNTVDAQPPQSVSSIHEGEFFGEMASVLDEERSAWALADADCTVFVLPPEVFRRYLEQDKNANSRLIGLLAARLRDNNERMRCGGRL
ncbi:MAG TPA: YhjD/YihY/BrkB family envelope integrity protein [Spirochaetales bacterium]|nr:YhjD/YihY/BrkB family envelope integrity protein [Spirochaetales bacterium]